MQRQKSEYFLLLLSCMLLISCWVESNEDEGDAAYEEKLEAYAARHGADVDVSISNASGENQITISNLGTLGGQIGSNLKLPDGFPDDVVVFPGTKILSSSAVPNGFVLSGQSSEKAGVIASYVKQEMTKHGWTMKPANAQSQLMKAIQFTKGERMANISLIEAGPITSMQIITMRLGS